MSRAPRADRGVALVTVLIFLALVMPALVIVLDFMDDEGSFPVQSWQTEEAEELAAGGHNEAEWTVYGPWIAAITGGRLDGVQFAMDRDADGLEDFDGDLRHDERGTMMPYIGIDHLSAPWIRFPHLAPPARDISAGGIGRPGGSLPLVPFYGDYNLDGVVDYFAGEILDPGNPCNDGAGASPCVGLPFMPIGKRDYASPFPAPAGFPDQQDFLWPIAGALPYSPAAAYNPEALIVDQGFVSFWYPADSAAGDRFGPIEWQVSTSGNVNHMTPYADRIKGLVPRLPTDSFVTCEPTGDMSLLRDLSLASEGLDFSTTLEVMADRESHRPGAPAMPDFLPLMDPGTCLPWNRTHSNLGRAVYEGVVTDEGSRFPIYDFVHNPDDPYFHNPMILEGWTNVNASPPIALESSVWARLPGSDVAARGQDAHFAQRGSLALLATQVNSGNAAAALSYVAHHDIGDTSRDGDDAPDEERSDYNGDGRIDEIPRQWPANLIEVLDVQSIKLRDGSNGNARIEQDEWKPFSSTITNWSSRGEASTDSGAHCGIFPFGNGGAPVFAGCSDPDPDPALALRPALPLVAWPQWRDPILRCLETGFAGAYDLSSLTTTSIPPFALSDCIGWMPKLDFWQTPTGWPTGITAGGADPPENVVPAEVWVDHPTAGIDDWTDNRGECLLGLYDGGDPDPLDLIETWLTGLDGRSVWPEEFWLFVRCFWDPALTDQFEAKRADLETVFETLFDDGAAGSAAFPDVMGDNFPQVLSAKVVGHWAAWQWWYRYFDAPGNDCRDIMPAYDLSSAAEGAFQAAYAERHARYHGIGDLAIPVGDAGGRLAATSGVAVGYTELRGPYWDPADMGAQTDPGCPGNALDSDWPTLSTSVDLYNAGEDSTTCTIGVDPADRCRTVAVLIDDFSVLPAVYVANAMPGVAATAPYNGFAWDAVAEAAVTVPPSIGDFDDMNDGTADSEATRDDALVMQLLDQVAFFESPFATYFDDPDLHEPCLFQAMTPPYFLADDPLGLDTDPYNGVVSTINSGSFADLFDGNTATVVGTWYEADGRNDGDSSCAGVGAANDPSDWRPLRMRGKVNVNTAPHSILLATMAKACHFGPGSVGAGAFFDADCLEGSLADSSTAVLRYREWFHLDPTAPVLNGATDDQGTWSQWTLDAAHSAGSALEQYYMDVGLFDPFGGFMAGLTGNVFRDRKLEAHLAFGGNGGILRAPFRVRSQLLDVAQGFTGAQDPRDILTANRMLADDNISGEDADPSAAGLFARVDQDLDVGSEGYRVETRGRFGSAQASRFSVIAMVDLGLGTGFFFPLVVENETSRGVTDPAGLFFSGYYR